MCESILVLGNNCLNYRIYMKVFWATGWRSWRRPTSSWSCLSSKLRAGELRLHLVDIKVCVRVFSREDKADDHNNAMRLLIIVQQSEGTASIFKSPHIWSVVGRWHCDFADWPEKRERCDQVFAQMIRSYETLNLKMLVRRRSWCYHMLKGGNNEQDYRLAGIPSF